MEIWITVIAVGGGCMVLAALLYFFVPAKQVKIPAVALGTAGGLATGAVLGLLAAVFYGDPLHKTVFAEQYKPEPMPSFGGPAAPKAGGAPVAKKGGGGDAAKKKGGGGDAAKKKGGGGGGGGPRSNIYGPNYPLVVKNDAGPAGAAPGVMTTPGTMGSMMGGPPNPKTQLDSLVAKLDVLTRKPLAVSLNDDQRAKIREQLEGLVDAKDLKPDDAKKRLDALVEILKNDKATLEAAGFVWPGDSPKLSLPGDKPNPFSSDASSEHLKGLLGTLGEAKPK